MCPSAQSKQSLRTRCKKIFNVLSDGELAADGDTKHLNRLDPLETGDCWRQYQRGSSAAWRDEEKIDQLRSIQRQVIISRSVFNICNFVNTRLAIRCWNDEVCIFRVFIHVVPEGDMMKIGSIDDEGRRSNSRALDDAG